MYVSIPAKAPPSYQTAAIHSTNEDSYPVISDIGPYSLKQGWMQTTQGDLHKYCNDLLHNDFGPAVIIKSGKLKGKKEYRIHGKLHRIDGPAIEFKGYDIWCLNDKIHRVNGPAVIYHLTGDTEYWQHGKKHRVNGPAVIYQELTEWWLNGVLHRGCKLPAVIKEGNDDQYWTNGKQLRLKTFCGITIFY